jgi:hypothetical protein
MERKSVAAIRELKADEIWTVEKMNIVRSYILAKSKKQSRLQKLRNKLLGIKFQVQDYLESAKK